MNTKNEKIGLLERAGYCSIEVGNQFSWTMVSTYLSVFYTDVVGLAPAVVSIILLIARIWDGINDPMMGAITEKTNTKWGKYRPYLIFGAPFVGLFSIMTFTKLNATGSILAVYAAVSYILCGMAYTAVCIAQGSLVNVMTRDLNTRVQLNSIRQMGSGITGLILSATAMPLILYFGGGSTSSARGYFLANIFFATLGTICVMFGGIVCKERITKEKAENSVSLKESFAYVLKNKNVLLVIGAAIFTTASILGRIGVMSYYFIYYIGNPAIMAPALVLFNIFTILGQAYVPFLVSKLGKKKSCVVAYVVQAISLIIVFMGGPNNLIPIYIGSALNGFAHVVPGIMYSITGDIVDREEVRTGERSDGMVYSMFSLGTKIGVAGGGSIGVAILGAMGFVANQEQTAATLRGINMLTNLGPIVFLALAALCVLAIDITEEEAKANKKLLEEREAQKEN